MPLIVEIKAVTILMMMETVMLMMFTESTLFRKQKKNDPMDDQGHGSLRRCHWCVHNEKGIAGINASVQIMSLSFFQKGTRITCRGN